MESPLKRDLSETNQENSNKDLIIDKNANTLTQPEEIDTKDQNTSKNTNKSDEIEHTETTKIKKPIELNDSETLID